MWGRADLVLKVKEPQVEEHDLLRPGLVLFTYLHLAAYPVVADALLEKKVTGIAYETVQAETGTLPLLAPMSEVAGRMAPQVGSHFLEREHGGRGVLLGGTPGVRPARVVVLGAGNVGWNAAWIAQGMEAEVLLLDRDLDRLRWVDQIHRRRIMTLASNRLAVERAVADADLVIGAVLVPGGRAPVVVTRAMVSSMRKGAVIVDCAIDQGGCVETIHETSHADPVYEVDGVLHYAVGNIPGAVPHTSTYTLTNATLSYIVPRSPLGGRGHDHARSGAGQGRQHHGRRGHEPHGGRGARARVQRRSPRRWHADRAGWRATGEPGRDGRPPGAIVGHRDRLPERPRVPQVVGQHRLRHLVGDTRHLGVEVGALAGGLGEIPGVRGDVEDRDVQRHPGRHLAERQLHHSLHRPGDRERLVGGVGGRGGTRPL